MNGPLQSLQACRCPGLILFSSPYHLFPPPQPQHSPVRQLLEAHPQLLHLQNASLLPFAALLVEDQDQWSCRLAHEERRGKAEVRNCMTDSLMLSSVTWLKRVELDPTPGV